MLPRSLAETAAYLRDFDELSARHETTRDLFDATLQKYPRRINPRILWLSVSTKAA